MWIHFHIFYDNHNTFIAVFRAGEQGRFWYAVLGGSLEVRYHAPDTENKVTPVIFQKINRLSKQRHTHNEWRKSNVSVCTVLCCTVIRWKTMRIEKKADTDRTTRYIIIVRKQHSVGSQWQWKSDDERDHFNPTIIILISLHIRFCLH